MKKELLFLCMALMTLGISAQTPIPNADFELWTTNTIENPMYFPFTSNQNVFRDGRSSNVVKHTPAYHGQYAVELTTTSNALAFMMNTDPHDGNMQLWTNGIAYTEMPTGIRGYYKYNVATADSALIFFTFRKNHAIIGDYEFKIGGVKTNYSLFDFEFTPVLTQTPDSLIIGFVASDYYKNNSGVPGSMLVLDSLTLKGVTANPVAFDGDFENWELMNMGLSLNNWNDTNKEGVGLNRSVDMKKGQYALELTSYLGDQDNQPRNQPGFLSNGYWDNTCGCMKGGIPFVNKIDTLSFWYKYNPVSGDQAQVNIGFRKNGTQFDGRSINLNASATYQYAELPFEMGMDPDSVIISIISSLWANTSLSFVGSKLTIDDLNFKTKANTTNNSELELMPLLSPNPTHGIINFNNSGNDIKSIAIYSVTGEVMYKTLGNVSQIDIAALKSAVYIVQIETDRKTYINKIVKL